MRKIIVTEWMSLDGVIQSPAYADEDASDGFRLGGWHPSYFDARSMAWVVDNVTQAGGFLLGRRTYEVFAAHWPHASEQEQMLARPLNALPKYIASRTFASLFAWQQATLLTGEVAAAVAALKQTDGKYLLVIGSSRLVQELIAHDLVDEFRLMIDPLILGRGRSAPA
ncbi:MAG TPA: dihydrofolate reductase family protein, partial [Planctomycetota bacterium]|nr:dihydrofolate reductase family protein [Planctomycetota bacterium]